MLLSELNFLFNIFFVAIQLKPFSFSLVDRQTSQLSKLATQKTIFPQELNLNPLKLFFILRRSNSINDIWSHKDYSTYFLKVNTPKQSPNQAQSCLAGA
uniref:Uncharacterized protein n=1 Tax=Ectopseudomonas oleovorans TaxID=301 RepID=A0A653B0Y7_ECTOL